MGNTKASRYNYYAGRGKIATVVKGPMILRNYFLKLTATIVFHEDKDIDNERRQKAHWFLCHVYHSIKSLIRKKDVSIDYDANGLIFIPVYSRLKDKVFGRQQPDIHLLKREGVLEFTPEDKAKKRSRYFSLPKDIWEKAQRIENDYTRKAWRSLTTGEFSKYTIYNIINGNPIKRANSHKYSRQGKDIKATTIVREGMDAISPCVFNPKYVGIWVNGLERVYRKKKEELQVALHTSLSEQEKEILETDLRSLERKYINERSSQRVILAQQPELVKGELSTKGDLLYRYFAAYVPQRSGRLSEIGGGLQNASRVFKFRAFKNVEAINYDLKASQAMILIQELEASRLDSSWLKTYINDPKGKETYAARIGVNTDTWKQCLYATIMGAVPHLPDTAVPNALMNYFKNDLGLSEAKASIKKRQALRKYQEVAGDLIRETRKWRDYLISEDCHYLTRSKPGYRIWKNAAGMLHKKYCLDRNNKLFLYETVKNHELNPEKHSLEPLTKRKTAEAKRSIAAFILQGQEACFIHELTKICVTNHIKVLRNEHDGVITDAEISPKLVDLAAQKSGLKHAELAKKPLASTQERKDAQNLIRR